MVMRVVTSSSCNLIAFRSMIATFFELTSLLVEDGEEIAFVREIKVIALPDVGGNGIETCEQPDTMEKTSHMNIQGITHLSCNRFICHVLLYEGPSFYDSASRSFPSFLQLENLYSS